MVKYYCSQCKRFHRKGKNYNEHQEQLGSDGNWKCKKCQTISKGSTFASTGYCKVCREHGLLERYDSLQEPIIDEPCPLGNKYCVFESNRVECQRCNLVFKDELTIDEQEKEA
jgi:hypothetical protein